VRNNEKKDPSDVNLINLVEEKLYTIKCESRNIANNNKKTQSIESTPQKTTTNVPLFQSQGSNEFWF